MASSSAMEKIVCSSNERHCCYAGLTIIHTLHLPRMSQVDRSAVPRGALQFFKCLPTHLHAVASNKAQQALAAKGGVVPAELNPGEGSTGGRWNWRQTSRAWPLCVSESSGQSDSAAQSRLLSALFAAGRFINHLRVTGAGSDSPIDMTAGLTANALRRGHSENIRPEKTWVIFCFAHCLWVGAAIGSAKTVQQGCSVCSYRMLGVGTPMHRSLFYLLYLFLWPESGIAVCQVMLWGCCSASPHVYTCENCRKRP